MELHNSIINTFKIQLMSKIWLILKKFEKFCKKWLTK